MTTRNSRTPRGSFGTLSIEEPERLHTDIVSLAQSHHTLSHEEKRIAEEFGKQTFIISKQMEKSIHAASAIQDVRANLSYGFQDTVASIVEKQREVRGEDFESYVAAFNRGNVEGLAKNLLGVAAVSAENIGTMVYKSLDLPPVLPPPPSLWKRIFG